MILNIEFKVSDLMDYERTQDISLLHELECYESFVIFDLIKLGKGWSDDDTIKYIEGLLSQGLSIQDIANDIVEALIGRQVEENDEKVKRDINTKYSDILEDYYDTFALAESLSIGEFLNMSTRFMHRYAKGVNSRYVQNMNQQIRKDYRYIGMLLSAVTGNLKACPEIDMNGNLKGASAYEQLEMMHRDRGV